MEETMKQVLDQLQVMADTDSQLVESVKTLQKMVVQLDARVEKLEKTTVKRHRALK